MFGAFFGEIKSDGCSYECNFCNAIMKAEKFWTFIQFLLMRPQCLWDAQTHSDSEASHVGSNSILWVPRLL